MRLKINIEMKTIQTLWTAGKSLLENPFGWPNLETYLMMMFIHYEFNIETSYQKASMNSYI